MSLPQRMYVYHLLKVANTEVESHSLKSVITVESHHLWILVDEQGLMSVV